MTRGIFDTDGSTFFDEDTGYKRRYPILDITMKNNEVVDWITERLRGHDFAVIRRGRCIRLRGRETFHKWFKEIAPKNNLHISKYSKWVRECQNMGS